MFLIYDLCIYRNCDYILFFINSIEFVRNKYNGIRYM